MGIQTSECRNNLFRNIPITRFVELPVFPGNTSVLDETAFSVFLTCGQNHSEQQGCSGSSEDGHNSCHPIYLMFVFASAVVLEASHTCAAFGLISLSCYCMVWKLNPGSDPSHTAEDLLLNWAVARTGSIAVSATVSPCRCAVSKCQCFTSSLQCPPRHSF